MFEFLKEAITTILGTILTISSFFVVSDKVVKNIATTTTPVLQTATTTTHQKIITQNKTVETTVTKKVVTKNVISEPVVIPPIIPPKPITILPPPNFENINKESREAVVNLLCTTKGRELSPISGTGVIVTNTGVVMTNAHIAQYLLLKDYNQKDFVQCLVRTGSPAYPRYKVELAYISPDWIENNKSLLKETNPKGTGQYDFAFLKITESIDGSPLPVFKNVTPNTREIIKKDEPVLLVSYPASFLKGQSILQNLNVASSLTNIQDVATFVKNTIDIISVGGTIISQKGASGGAVIDRDGTLIGIISTSSDGEQTSERELFAITPSHISRSLESNLGITLTEFLLDDMENFAKKFQETVAPVLTKLLTDELNKSQ